MSRASTANELVQIRLFGGLEICQDSRKLKRFPTKKVCSAFLLLAFEESHALSRDALCAALWPEATHQSLNNRLRQVIFLLKRWLSESNSDGLLESENSLIKLVNLEFEIDVQTFLSHVAEDDTDSLKSAAQLYRGSISTELQDNWLRLLRDQCDTQAIRVLRILAERLLQRESEVALEYARRLVGINRLSEDDRILYISLLIRNGELVAAEREYAELEILVYKHFGAIPAISWTNLLRDYQPAFPVKSVQEELSVQIGTRLRITRKPIIWVSAMFLLLLLGAVVTLRARTQSDPVSEFRNLVRLASETDDPQSRLKYLHLAGLIAENEQFGPNETEISHAFRANQRLFIEAIRSGTDSKALSIAAGVGRFFYLGHEEALGADLLKVSLRRVLGRTETRAKALIYHSFLLILINDTKDKNLESEIDGHLAEARSIAEELDSKSLQAFHNRIYAIQQGERGNYELEAKYLELAAKQYHYLGDTKGLAVTRLCRAMMGNRPAINYEDEIQDRLCYGVIAYREFGSLHSEWGVEMSLFVLKKQLMDSTEPERSRDAIRIVRSELQNRTLRTNRGLWVAGALCEDRGRVAYLSTLLGDSAMMREDIDTLISTPEIDSKVKDDIVQLSRAALAELSTSPSSVRVSSTRVPVLSRQVRALRDYLLAAYPLDH